MSQKGTKKVRDTGPCRERKRLGIQDPGHARIADEELTECSQFFKIYKH